LIFMDAVITIASQQFSGASVRSRCLPPHHEDVRKSLVDTASGMDGKQRAFRTHMMFDRE
jgi:hypothetical protein